MRLKVSSCTLLLALLTLSAPAWAAKVQVCHIPPGNPSNFHTITISESALPAHLGHGDLVGPCFAHCDTLCSDGNACSIDACNASEQCLLTHPQVNCDDSNLCTTDSCDAVTGCANVAKTCPNSDACTVNACDPLTGNCVGTPVVCPAGQSCNPANGMCVNSDPCAGVDCGVGPVGSCTIGVCQSGVCVEQNLPAGTPCFAIFSGPSTCNGGPVCPDF